MRLLIALLAGPVGLAAPAAAQVQTEVCLSAAQVASSAGPCPGCAMVIDLDVREVAGAYVNAYSIRANNGWSAQAAESPSDPTLLTGTGTWGPDLGAWSDRPFDLTMRAEGSRIHVTLRHDADFGTLTAEYACR